MLHKLFNFPSALVRLSGDFLLMTGKRQRKQKASLHPMSWIAHFEKRNISALLDLSAEVSNVTFQQKGSRFGGGGAQVKRHAFVGQ